MGLLKKLASIKSSNESSTDNKKPILEDKNAFIDNSLSSTGQTYYQDGYGSSKKASGSTNVLKMCLEDIFSKFKEECRLNQHRQENLKKPFFDELSRVQAQINSKKTLLEIKEDEHAEAKDKLEKLENDIPNVKVNPEQYGIEAEKSPKLKFIIGILILIPITIYLLTFYMSASYSAFFREFDLTNITISASVLDGKAFTKAFKDGFLEGVFVVTIPFVFMGLGYLIHMFQKEKYGGVKIATLLMVTFIFDAIIAYMIEAKIYDVKRGLLDAPYSLKMAFSSTEFYGILFAGFVVYVIWGLVFDFILKEHEEMDKITRFIDNIKSQILLAKDKISSLSGQISEIKIEVSELLQKKEVIQKKIDGFVFEKKSYLIYHNEYLKGWTMAIKSELAMPKDDSEKLVHHCHEASKEHLSKLGITKEEAEQLIFS